MMNEVVLSVHSTQGGPWVPVRRLRRVSTFDATKDDVVKIEFTDHDLLTDTEPIVLKGTVTKDLNFPVGKVRVVRVSGNTPVTVIGYQEKHGDGKLQATTRLSVW